MLPSNPHRCEKKYDRNEFVNILNMVFSKAEDGKSYSNCIQTFKKTLMGRWVLGES